jgi:hypothetical protein
MGQRDQRVVEESREHGRVWILVVALSIVAVASVAVALTASLAESSKLFSRVG